MQLVDQKKRSSREELEPCSTRRWSIPCARTSGRCSSGSVCAAVAAVLTALKTGNVLLWPCAALIIGIGTVRAFQMRKYERRTEVLTFEQAEALGAALCDRRHGLRRRARRLVLRHDFRQRRRGRAHDLRRRRRRLHRRRRGPQLRPSQADPVSHPAGLRPDVAGAGDAWRFLLHRPRALLVLFFIGLKGINLSLHASSSRR